METLKIKSDSWMLWVLKEFANLTWYDIKGLNTCSFVRYLIWGLAKGISIACVVVAIVVFVVYALIGSLAWLICLFMFNPIEMNPALGVGLCAWVLLGASLVSMVLHRGICWLFKRFWMWMNLRYEQKKYDINVEDIKKSPPNAFLELVKSYHSKICRKIELE